MNKTIENLKKLKSFHNGSYGTDIDKAIKALEQEPCEDAISRQAAIEAVMDLCKYYTPTKSVNHPHMDFVIETLQDLPPVTPQEPRWIPVTEDTPPKGTICLWCNKQGSVFISEITYRSECNSYVGKHGYFSNGLDNYGDIVAWMPLPQPYTESEEA